MLSVLTWIVCSLETDINKHSCSVSPEGTDLLALRTSLSLKSTLIKAAFKTATSARPALLAICCFN